MFNRIKIFIETKGFHNFIISIIVFNGITMGLETSKELINSYGYIFDAINFGIIFIFVVELSLRIYVYKLEFFKNSWNLFDFFVVAISLVPASDGLEILRVLRVLRLFRLITAVPQMRKIVSALASVIPGMASIAAILMLFFYIFAIMGTQLFSETFPKWFGDLGESFYTLFQIMTLESWSMGIVRPIMEVHPFAWIYFLIFIFVATFIMINLIVAVVVDAMGTLNNPEDITLKEVKNLKSEIQELKKMILELKK